jgi:hypothetical protein
MPVDVRPHSDHVVRVPNVGVHNEVAGDFSEVCHVGHEGQDHHRSRVLLRASERRGEGVGAGETAGCGFDGEVGGG